jgi:transposase
LAVQRVAEGGKQNDVAAFLGFTERAVNGWVAAHRTAGDEGLRGKTHPGAKPKPSNRQEASVLSWLARSPRSSGYETNLWTPRRLAELIAKRFGVRFSSNYLAEWLIKRGDAPQKPETRAIERNNVAIGRWLADDWPRIKKTRAIATPTSS